jgi:hypothetical protein
MWAVRKGFDALEQSKNEAVMDKKLVVIVVLTVTATMLMIANFVSQPAQAETAVTGYGYQVATARMQQGGEGVYILDSRSGLLAIFSYDPGVHQMRPRAIHRVVDFFGGPPAK